MTPTLRRALLSTLPLLTVAACDNPVSRHFEWQRHAANVEFAPEPLYCYRTLAKSDCFVQPLDRRESNRLVSNYGPAPGRVVVVAAPASRSGQDGRGDRPCPDHGAAGDDRNRNAGGDAEAAAGRADPAGEAHKLIEAGADAARSAMTGP